jgi:hypothetical protein
MVRNSAEPDAAPLMISRGRWLEFMSGVKTGAFDAG